MNRMNLIGKISYLNLIRKTKNKMILWYDNNSIKPRSWKEIVLIYSLLIKFQFECFVCFWASYINGKWQTGAIQGKTIKKMRVLENKSYQKHKGVCYVCKRDSYGEYDNSLQIVVQDCRTGKRMQRVESKTLS